MKWLYIALIGIMLVTIFALVRKSKLMEWLVGVPIVALVTQLLVLITIG